MTTMLSRSAWTSAANGRAGRNLNPDQVDSITCHWPAAPGVIGKASQGAVAERLRGYRSQHINQGWADIGYNFAIDQAGRVWELTGLVRGAHAGGDGSGNSRSVGVLWVMGMDETPTPEAIEVFRWLRSWVLARMPRATAVRPHSYWTSTACPGDAIRGLISSGALTSGAAPASASPGGFLMSLSDKQQREVYDAIMDLRPGRAGKYHDGPGFAFIRKTSKLADHMQPRVAHLFDHYRVGTPGKWNDGPTFSFFKNLAVRLSTVLPGVSGYGHQGDLWPRIEAALDRTSGIDTDALARALAEAIPDDLAKQVVDELSNRLEA